MFKQEVVDVLNWCMQASIVIEGFCFLFAEDGSQLQDDKTKAITSTSVLTSSANGVTDPLTVNTQTGSTAIDTVVNKEKKPQVSPGTSVFIAEQVTMI